MLASAQNCVPPLPPVMQDWELLSEAPLLQQGGIGGAAQPAAAAAAGHEHAALSPGDVSITWRGDGLYFATASLDSPGEQHHHRAGWCPCLF